MMPGLPLEAAVGARLAFLRLQGPVSALAVEPGGNQMVTAGVDGQVRYNSTSVSTRQ